MDVVSLISLLLHLLRFTKYLNLIYLILDYYQFINNNIFIWNLNILNVLNKKVSNYIFDLNNVDNMIRYLKI